jgi:fatty acid desaturase
MTTVQPIDCLTTQAPAAVPAALRGDNSSLSPAGRQAIRTMMRPDAFHFLLQLGLAWLGIVGAIVAAEYLDHVAVTVLALLYIATRQHIFALLTHEQVHRHNFRSKRGDVLCNLMASYPLLITVEGNRAVHLAHHRAFFTAADPEYRRKQGPVWTFPQRALVLVRTMLCDLVGLSALQFFKGKRQAKSAGQGPTGIGRVLRPAYYLLLAVLFTVTGTWGEFLLYWVLPLFTALQVIIRWGAICEHKYDLVGPTVIESTPFIQQRWWQAWLLPDLNISYHIYHHWYPAVPFAKLPRVHDVFRREGLVVEENIFHGYGAYLKYLLGWPARAAEAVERAPASLSKPEPAPGPHLEHTGIGFAHYPAGADPCLPHTASTEPTAQVALPCEPVAAFPGDRPGAQEADQAIEQLLDAGAAHGSL